LKIELSGKLSGDKGHVNVKPEVFDRGDGHVIVRYKIYRTLAALSFEVTLDGEHLVRVHFNTLAPFKLKFIKKKLALENRS
jgi:hypothetical protein